MALFPANVIALILSKSAAEKKVKKTRSDPKALSWPKHVCSLPFFGPTLYREN